MSSSSSPPASHPYSFGAFSGGPAASVSAFNPPILVPPPPPAFNQGREGPRDVIVRRIATFVHLKAVITGRQLQAGIVQLSRKDLALIWDTEKTKKRSYRYFALGLALSPLLDLQTLTDLTRGLLTALNDIEALPEAAGATSGGLTGGAMATLALGGMGMGSGAEKRGVRNLFSNKLKPSKKGTFSDTFATSDGGSSVGIGSSASSSLAGVTDTLVGTLPFALDFVQTLVTLLDTLIEVYARILVFVAPVTHSSSPLTTSAKGLGHQRGQPSSSSMNSSSASVTAPMAVTASSRPSYVPMSAQSSAQSHHSHLAPPLSGIPFDDGKNTFLHHDPVSSPSVNLAPTTLELMNKIDAKIKKLLTPITKDLDSLARHIIKEELSLLESGSSASKSNLPSPPGTIRSTSSPSNNRYAGDTLAGPISTWTGLPQPPSSAVQGYGNVEEDGGIQSNTPAVGSASVHNQQNPLTVTTSQIDMATHKQQSSRSGTGASSGEWQRLR